MRKLIVVVCCLMFAVALARITRKLDAHCFSTGFFPRSKTVYCHTEQEDLAINRAICHFENTDAIFGLVRNANCRQHGDRIAQQDWATPARQKSHVNTGGKGKGKGAGYDPLEVSADQIETLELTVRDRDRKREIPALVYFPKSLRPTAVIVHSHGLGGTKYTSTFLGEHWAARGYVAVFVQHPGSDDSVWEDLPKWQRFGAMKKAASAENLNLRTGDVSAVIDQLEKWNVEESHALNRRMDLRRIGMTGHSFGAVTTQHVGGQTAFGVARAADQRIIAAIPMSPSPPRFGNAKKAFGKVKIPWMCMTGTHDEAIIGGMTAEDRLAVYPALPNGDKYELVLNDAEHSAFTETALWRDTKERNPNHHLSIKAISTAFWDSYLCEDAAARNWLQSDDVYSVLETKDRWQQK